MTQRHQAYVQCSNYELWLNILIDIVEAGYIRSSITDNQISSLPTELVEHLIDSRLLSDISLNLHNIVQRSHFLEINRHYPSESL